nr:hypothetical protein [uncultured bacterium]
MNASTAHARVSAAEAPKRRRLRWALLALLALGGAIAAVSASSLASRGITPRLLGPYIEQRARGNGPLETIGRWIGSALLRLDRGRIEPQLQYPDWVGPRAERPSTAAAARRTVIAFSPDEAIAAIADARAGDVITFAPGRYRFQGTGIAAVAPGRADAPIVVRAERFGTVHLQFDMVEGIVVSAPWWTFENLVIEGVCATHDACEHAFHVAGAADNVKIRNNELRDFNAHVKINGEGGRFPDDGVIEGNRLVNASPRRANSPVTPIDIVAANGWTIRGNLIADFVKAQGDRISYGAFAKGAGSNNRFIGNVVLCEHRLRGAPGRRIGLSFGGGGSDPTACRDRRCIVEHDAGVMHSNLIAACSDVGIYVNRAARTQLVHNTLLDTGGISVRFGESSAEVQANLVDGPIHARDGGSIHAQDNRETSVLALYAGWHPVRALFRGAAELDLAWESAPPTRPGGEKTPDLCGATRAATPALGAFDNITACTRVKSWAGR